MLVAVEVGLDLSVVGGHGLHPVDDGTLVGCVLSVPCDLKLALPFCGIPCDETDGVDTILFPPLVTELPIVGFANDALAIFKNKPKVVGVFLQTDPHGTFVPEAGQDVGGVETDGFGRAEGWVTDQVQHRPVCKMTKGPVDVPRKEEGLECNNNNIISEAQSSDP